MTDLRQDDFKIEMSGIVVPPPTGAEIVARVAEAAARKESLTLTPGECRVLTGLLEEL